MMSNPPPEATIMDALRHYQEVSGGDLINELGVTANGRIVKLTDPSCEQQKGLRNTLATQLHGLRPGIEINPDSTVKDFYKTLTEYKISSLKTPENTAANLSTESIEVQDARIQKTLENLKLKYKNEFDNLAEITETDITYYGEDQGSYCTTETKKDQKRKFGESVFKNSFNRDKWSFINNKKSKQIYKTFFMSNVVAHQFEEAFKKNGHPMVYPKTIEHSLISNDRTLQILKEHHGRYETEAFKEEYLTTTVNGKSTVRIAEDFGLEIYKLTVIGKVNTMVSVAAHVRPVSRENEKLL